MKKTEKKQPITGIISITAMGTGYVSVIDFDEDVQIQPHFLNTALHGDEVEITLFPREEKEKRSGEVVKILNRIKKEFVGTVDKKKGGKFAFISPDEKRMYTDIFIAPAESGKLKNGDKVFVRLKKWTDPKKNPEGEILKILGKKGNNNVEMESIVLEKGFQISFPLEVEREAKLIEEKAYPIPQKDISARKDIRHTTTFTIDPEDAKDFDDAISFKEISSDVFEIGVHIADVSHYVTEGSQMNKEAIHRGVSIYLVDRTIPMLPEALSNGVCSLNPNQDKLTFSVILTITAKGEIQKKWLGKTIIKSNKRFVYEEAQKVLDNKEGSYYHELNCLNKIAKIFKQKRVAQGALDFDSDEVKFRLDATGKPIEVIERQRLDAHKLVEEFMILANNKVALYLSNEIKKLNRGASIYRIHGLPKEEAMNGLLTFLNLTGHETKKYKKNISSKELNDLFEQIKGAPEEALVKTVAMRSMAKAIYSTNNIGHYGLALEEYTHFTSPIRRYADLLVHRVLEKHLKGVTLNEKEVLKYHILAGKLSQREIGAVEAERDSISYKQVEYMIDKVGNIYEGVISGVTKWGIFVEESRTKANGMISMKTMKDDFYVFNEKTYSIIGERTKKKYSLGDKVKIKITGGSLEQKTLDFAFV